MRNQLKAPISFSRAQRGYYYSEDTYRLPFLQLSEGELLAIYFSERILHQFRGTPSEPVLRRVIDKLAEMLPDSVTVRLDFITDFLLVLPAVQAEYDLESFLCDAASRNRPAPAEHGLLDGKPERDVEPTLRSLRALARRRRLVRLRLLPPR
jgi:predicted DNA-binding transcriptional regulator YafY